MVLVKTVDAADDPPARRHRADLVGRGHGGLQRGALPNVHVAAQCTSVRPRARTERQAELRLDLPCGCSMRMSGTSGARHGVVQGSAEPALPKTPFLPANKLPDSDQNFICLTPHETIMLGSNGLNRRSKICKGIRE